MAENKNIEVGGRLHSIATGNVLAGADEILDDSKNKKQSEINTETYSLVNDVNERLSGLSPDQQSALNVAAKATNNETKLDYYVCDTEGNVAAKVIAPATGYVLSTGGSMKVKMTNANTVNNVTLNINSTGAKPLYYDGERASANNTWETGETVEVYYDGTSFYANSVACGSGDGAFDISAKTGDTYETLSAALTAANSILSVSKRKGGMSIKFIQTTPAKYTVVKTEGATEQPTGTEIQSDPGIISGIYTAGELSAFSTLPATLNSSLTYYLAVTETVDEQEVTTYTTWVITYAQSTYNKYVQYTYTSEYENTTAGNKAFISIANWQKNNDDLLYIKTSENGFMLGKSTNLVSIVDVKTIICTIPKSIVTLKASTDANAIWCTITFYKGKVSVGTTNSFLILQGSTVTKTVSLSDDCDSFVIDKGGTPSQIGEMLYLELTSDYYEVNVKQRFTNLDNKVDSVLTNITLDDTADSELNKSAVKLSLRKNTGTVQEPHIETIAEHIIVSANDDRAGVLSSSDRQKISAIYSDKALNKVELSYNTDSASRVVAIPKGYVECTFTTDVAAFVHAVFYDKDDNEILSLDGGLAVNPGSPKTLQGYLSEDCVRIVLSRGGVTGNLYTYAAITYQDNQKITREKALFSEGSINGTVTIHVYKSGVSFNTFLPKGNIVITIPAVSSAAWRTFNFYDKNGNALYESEDILIQANTAFSRTVEVSDDVYKVVVTNSNSIACDITFASNGTIKQRLSTAESRLTNHDTHFTATDSDLNKIKESIGGTTKYVTNAASQDILVHILKTAMVVTLTTEVTAFLTITFYDADDNVVGLISSTLVNVGQTKTFDVSLLGDCTKINVAKGGATYPERDTTITISFDNFKPVHDSVIEELNPTVLGEKELHVTSANTSDTFACLLPAGNLHFYFNPASTAAWVNATMYDKNDVEIATFNSILIQANADAEKNIFCERDVYKIVIGNTNKVARLVEVSSGGSLKGRVKTLEEKVAFDFDISIPSVVYLRTAQEFSIWYRNVIFGSQAFRNGNYSIRCQKKESNTYSKIGTNCTYDKFNYVPSEEEEFDLEIRIINTYTEIVAFSKVVHFVVKDPANIVNRSPKIVLLGDSFTDGHNVSKYVWTFLEQDGFTPVSVGVNSAGYGTYKDDAWAGYGIDWFHNSYYGYHRGDRPASDDVVISGQTYTRNEFIEDQGHTFDFDYYMNHYHNGDIPDCVVFNIGLNDTIWHTLNQSRINNLLGYLDSMITSVHTYNSSIKVIICTVTPQPEEDAYTSNFSNDWMTAETGKARQEKWNKALIDHFDTQEYQTAGVYVAPTNAHFDANHAIYTEEIEPDKFDSSIKETITNDIHPAIIGAKYIADMIVNTIEGLLQ